MQIYDKPVRLLMREMAESFEMKSGKSITRKQAVEWFAQHFPKIKKGTIHCHLIKLSTNNPTRLNYSVIPKEDDLFFRLDSDHYRLYNPVSDPAPIYEATLQSDNMTTFEDDAKPTCSTEFAYESDLRNYLSKNLSILEPCLKLYQDEGITGIEFPVGGRFIDILAVDKNGAFVVIELKVSRGYDRVVGQILRYIGWIRKNQAEPDQKVRGIIVAREINEDLILACSNIPDIKLYEYQLSFKVNPVNIETTQ